MQILIYENIGLRGRYPKESASCELARASKIIAPFVNVGRPLQARQRQRAPSNFARGTAGGGFEKSINCVQKFARDSVGTLAGSVSCGKPVYGRKWVTDGKYDSRSRESRLRRRNPSLPNISFRRRRTAAKPRVLSYLPRISTSIVLRKAEL